MALRGVLRKGSVEWIDDRLTEAADELNRWRGDYGVEADLLEQIDSLLDRRLMMTAEPTAAGFDAAGPGAADGRSAGR